MCLKILRHPRKHIISKTEEQPAPTPTPAPSPEPGVLPADWDNLTSREKADLNPFDCDIETQWVSADDGTCINKATEPPPISTDSFPFILGEHASDINCGYDTPRLNEGGRIETQLLFCGMHIHLKPTMDIDPDSNQPLWPYFTKRKNPDISAAKNKLSEHCLAIDGRAITVEILDGGDIKYSRPIEAGGFSEVSEGGLSEGFCRILTAGSDVQFWVYVKIAGWHFDADVLASLDYQQDIEAEGEAMIRLQSDPEIEIPVRYKLKETYVF